MVNDSIVRNMWSGHENCRINIYKSVHLVGSVHKNKLSCVESYDVVTVLSFADSTESM